MSLGIDVGSRFLKIAELEQDGRTACSAYLAHGGRPLLALEEAHDQGQLHRHRMVGITGQGSPALARALGLPVTDLCKATIRGVRSRVPEARNILDIGASSVTLIEMDETGKLKDISTNSVCAAGTGSFLDAQAARMGVDFAESQHFGFTADPPSIATRCAVFAKSDLIHRQQEGYGREALWCGLCKGLSTTLLQTLLRGRPLEGRTVVTGGVARNREVLRWLRELAGEEILTFEEAAFAAALGTAYLAMEDGGGGPLVFPRARLMGSGTGIGDGLRRPPLKLGLTDFPSFEVAEAWADDQGNEIRISSWPAGEKIRGYLGVDVGSTSTKTVLVQEDGSVLLDIYRKTAGDPIGATKALFLALEGISHSRRSPVEILGCGTTGSGRKLVGAVIGADAVINEISAHLAGAAATDPEADTIFEIGGQDSKFIRACNGVMRDSNMNYVCAAGTGSFVEEQALKLGFRVEDLGDLVMGIAPPHTSDRCTVFMEQDLERLIQQGYSPAEALAAVMYSVAENYLAKVVGNRSYSRARVFFCGATARNRGLVAGFEQLLGAKLVVSPFCHVLGAFGVALLTRDRMSAAGGASRFKGLDLSKRRITLTQEECDLCTNACRITFAHIQGEEEVPSWGYLCGRDPQAQEKRRTTEFEPFRLRGKLEALAFARHRQKPSPGGAVVGLPRTLSTFSHGPLWRTFLSHLGCRVRLSPPSDEDTRKAANSLVGSDYCFPAKLAHGHVGRLLEDPRVEWVFMPHTVSDPVPPEHTNAFFCPVVCSLPAMARSALNVAGRPGAELILSPQIDLRWDEKHQLEELAARLSDPLAVSQRVIRKAWQCGLAAQATFERLCKEEGKRLLDRLAANGETVIVALGRAYNLFDNGANLDLPLKIAEQGYVVVPADLVPIHEVELEAGLRNIYWVYGQRLLKALVWARDRENVHPVWFTNFKCGPDSFLLTYAAHLMGEKPFLILELDEHGGDAGYLTRIEAFLDVVRGSKGLSSASPPIPSRTDPVDTFRNRTIWVPALHPIAGPLAAAAMRGEGFDARAMPGETAEDLAVGRQVTRGGECIPMTVTIGRLLRTLREKGSDGTTDALFMPSARGPCRFGQYNLLERMILEREGLGEVAIMAPNNDNAYQGLGEGLRRKIWAGSLIGDLLFKVGCRFRPYVQDPQRVDRMVEEAALVMERAFETGAPVRPAFKQALAPFRALPKPPSTKPLVGVVGEIFVRCNFFSNQRVVDAIEAQGGEAWLSPFHEWILYACWEHERRAKAGLDILGRAKSYLKNRYLFESEHVWSEEVADLLGDRREPTIPESAEAGFHYAAFNFGGETLLTIGRTIKFFEAGASLVVNCSPFGCMPGQAISGILTEVQKDWGKPVVNLFYDGTGDLNRVIGVFLRNLSDGGRPVDAMPLAALSLSEMEPSHS
jgi:predicted CoA-substrate-specific enzyme activase